MWTSLLEECFSRILLIFVHTIIILSGFLQANAQDNEDVILHRWALGTGFHREMSSQVLIPPKYIHERADCKFIVQDTLPSGMYVDTYQLESGLREGGPFVYTTEKIDAENPEYLSKTHTIYVYGDLYVQENLDEGQMYWKGNVEYPVHLRYHSPSTESSTTVVRFQHPKLLVDANCVSDRYVIANVLLPCGQNTLDLCHWVSLKYVSDSDSVKFEVPVGNEEHRNLVTIVTVTTTILGCALLIFSNVCYKSGRTKAA